MKQLLLLATLFFSLHAAYGQVCDPCNIDSLALSPASNYPQGALYPDPFPVVTQGTPYDTSITYVMPKTYDTGIPGVGVVNVDQVQVSSVSGLPSGLQWSCNVPNCIFYPQQSQYGCVRICGTSFAPPGMYDITITVIGQALGVQQPITFDLEVEVVQGTVSTTSFSINGVSGCDTVVTTVEALIDGSPSPTTYSWDFGNGNTSTSKVPPVQTYTAPGVYPVILETNVGNLRLTDLSLSSINDNWENIPTECDDIIPIVNIPQCFNGAPDLFIRVYDGSSNLVFTTSEKTDQLPPVSWSGLAVDITSGPYTIHIYDNDVIGEDFIATFSLTNLTVGTHSFSGNQTSGTYTLVFVPTATYIDTVNVEVFATPADPTVTNITGTSAFCVGDTAVLASSPADTYQWIKDGVEITGATDSVYMATESGLYGVKITVGAGGCLAQGFAVDTIVVTGNPSVPNITYQAELDRLSTNNTGGNTRQWYFNGLPIPGATDGAYNNPTPGDYQLEFTNAAGCKTLSPVFTYTGVGIVNLGDNNLNFQMYPNPTNGQLKLEVNLGTNAPVTCHIYNMVGKLVYSQQLDGTTHGYNLNLTDLSKGVYMVELTSGTTRGMQRLVIH